MRHWWERTERDPFVRDDPRISKSRRHWKTKTNNRCKRTVTCTRVWTLGRSEEEWGLSWHLPGHKNTPDTKRTFAAKGKRKELHHTLLPPGIPQPPFTHYRISLSFLLKGKNKNKISLDFLKGGDDVALVLLRYVLQVSVYNLEECECCVWNVVCVRQQVFFSSKKEDIE